MYKPVLVPEEVIVSVYIHALETDTNINHMCGAASPHIR